MYNIGPDVLTSPALKTSGLCNSLLDIQEHTKNVTFEINQTTLMFIMADDISLPRFDFNCKKFIMIIMTILQELEIYDLDQLEFKSIAEVDYLTTSSLKHIYLYHCQL